MRLVAILALLFAINLKNVSSFPSYGSLAGLSDAELDLIIPTLQVRDLEPPPGPLNDTSAKLVNDPAHPWKPLRPGDIRGPCPGLNTLASHGVCILSTISIIILTTLFQWLPRCGIATPAQIVKAVQDGVNLYSFVKPHLYTCNYRV
jgi:unspecific peroxygenase